MTCPHCFEQVDERNAFCPNCGARMAEYDNAVAAGVANDPTFGALAQVNLLRLRGDWDAASQGAVGVLREYPNSGTAHSLMGDIHADQGKYEEAAQWYRMALELEPDNTADARKLAHAEGVLREQEAAANVAEADPLDDGPEPGIRLSPLVLAGWAAVTFLVVVIALGLWINGQRPRGDVAAGPAPSAPAAPAPSPGPDGGSLATPTPPPATETPRAPALTPPQPAPAPSRPALLPAEETLLDGLRQAAPSAPLSVVSVLLDPRGPSAVVTLDGSRVDGASPDWMEQVQRAAFAAARAALETGPDLARVTARVEMPLRAASGVRRDVAFIGELDRAGAEQADFAHPWWRPGLAPPAPPGAAPSP